MTLRCPLALALVLALASPAAASGLRLGSGPQTREQAFRNQTRMMDTRLASRFPTAVVPQVGRAAAIPAFRGTYRGPFLEPARAAARRHGIPEDLFLRLVQQESGWDPRAVSHAGARGLAQLMPETARMLGVDPDDPMQNLEGGARYLHMMYRRFGNWRLALAAYNAGAGAVEAHGGIPPFRETRDYVRIILGPD